MIFIKFLQVGYFPRGLIVISYTCYVIQSLQTILKALKSFKFYYRYCTPDVVTISKARKLMKFDARYNDETWPKNSFTICNVFASHHSIHPKFLFREKLLQVTQPVSGLVLIKR